MTGIETSIFIEHKICTRMVDFFVQIGYNG